MAKRLDLSHSFRATLHATVVLKTRVFESFYFKLHAMVVLKTLKTLKTGLSELPNPEILDVAKVDL